jgi:TonB family protein
MELMRALVFVFLFGWIAAAPAVAQQGGRTIENPVWLRQPTGEEFVENYPLAAAHQAVQGRATIECRVLLDTTVDCAVTDETPTGWGFGDAALAIAGTFRVQPARINGQEVEGGRIRRTIRFVLPDDAAWRQDATPFEVATFEAMAPPDLPNWDQAPNMRAVRASHPRSADPGRAVLQCRVNLDRRLNCQPLVEQPAGIGLAEAAMSLAPQFRVAEDQDAFVQRYARESFLLPVVFGASAESTPLSRHYTGVGPLVMPTLYPPREVYPPRALAANLPGEVVIVCTVAEARLSGCAVEREMPTDWGFSEPVLQVLTMLPPIPPEMGVIDGDQIRFSFEFEPN